MYMDWHRKKEKRSSQSQSSRWSLKERDAHEVVFPTFTQIIWVVPCFLLLSKGQLLSLSFPSFSLKCKERHSLWNIIYQPPFYPQIYPGRINEPKSVFRDMGSSLGGASDPIFNLGCRSIYATRESNPGMHQFCPESWLALKHPLCDF